MYMGFILFRSRGDGGGRDAMAMYLEQMRQFIAHFTGDQVAVNYAASKLHVQWDDSTDMR